MSQRTWQAQVSPPAESSPAGSDSRPAGSDSRPRPAEAAAGAPSGLRLTGHGSVLGVFVLCFLGLLASGWLGWSPLAGGAFAAAAGLAAARTQRTDLLTVTVSPPALFLVAVICVKGLTASGNVLLSTATGTLITLANAAPWLLAGTGLSLIIAFSRGLWGNVVALGKDLRGAPVSASGRPGDPGRKRPSAGH